MRESPFTLVEHLQSPPPEILWHYTSLDALMKILDSGSIWASHIRYLNDSSEYDHMVHTIDNRVCELRSEVMSQVIEDPTRCAALTSVHRILKAGISRVTYVSSFSAKKDDLSQWRGYCPPGQGVSIGFYSRAIKAAINPATHHPHVNPGQLGEVIYLKSDEGRSFDKWIESACEAPQEDMAVTNTDILRITISLAAAFYKDLSFKEEEEWRVILERNSLGGRPSKIHFRLGKSTLIPYQEITLGTQPHEFIKEIVVGPSPNLSLSSDAVRHLLRERRASAIEVYETDVPFRHW
jgi:hypothetical protein